MLNSYELRSQLQKSKSFDNSDAECDSNEDKCQEQKQKKVDKDQELNQSLDYEDLGKKEMNLLELASSRADGIFGQEESLEKSTQLIEFEREMLASRLFLDDFMTNACLLYTPQTLNQLSPEQISWDKLSGPSKNLYFKMIEIELNSSYAEANLDCLIEQSLLDLNPQHLTTLQQIEVRRLELVENFDQLRQLLPHVQCDTAFVNFKMVQGKLLLEKKPNLPIMTLTNLLVFKWVNSSEEERRPYQFLQGQRQFLWAGIPNNNN